MRKTADCFSPNILARAVLMMVFALIAGCSTPSWHGGSAEGQRVLRKPVVIDPQKRQEVIMTALGLLETPYRYGGAHPAAGFDCSGLVAFVFNAATANTLPHNTAAIASVSRPVSRANLKAGDLVFFNTLSRPNSHMGIYIGDGDFINAPSSGGRVRIDSLHNPWFARRLDSARTLFRQ